MLLQLMSISNMKFWMFVWILCNCLQFFIHDVATQSLSTALPGTIIADADIGSGDTDVTDELILPTTTLPEPDDCQSNPCQNGVCLDLVHSYNCSCVDGYMGDHCENDINECLSTPCLNGGLCSDHVDEYSCSCADGFTGIQCQTNIDECVGNPCVNDGTCTDQVNGYSCSCIDGFVGQRCMQNFDECSSSPCQNGGTCDDQLAAFTCSCLQTFAGSTCDTRIGSPCESSPCQHNGSCSSDSVLDYTCQCTYLYTGLICETKTHECNSNPCQNGGTCNHLENSYSCTCGVGYEGEHCQKFQSACTGQPCLNNGTCFDESLGFRCECTKDFTGKKCETEFIPEEERVIVASFSAPLKGTSNVDDVASILRNPKNLRQNLAKAAGINVNRIPNIQAVLASGITRFLQFTSSDIPAKVKEQQNENIEEIKKKIAKILGIEVIRIKGISVSANDKKLTIEITLLAPPVSDTITVMESVETVDTNRRNYLNTSIANMGFFENITIDADEGNDELLTPVESEPKDTISLHVEFEVLQKSEEKLNTPGDKVPDVEEALDVFEENLQKETDIFEGLPDVNITLKVEKESLVKTETSVSAIGQSCYNDPCENSGICSPINDGKAFTCTCPVPYTGDVCNKSPCNSPPFCDNAGSCKLTPFNISMFLPSCNCTPEYSGEQCDQQALIPRDKLAKKCRFSFDYDYDTIVKDKSAFAKHIKPQLAKTLQIADTRVGEVLIEKGSIVATLTILPGSPGSSDVDDVMNALYKGVFHGNLSITSPSGATLSPDINSWVPPAPVIIRPCYGGRCQHGGTCTEVRDSYSCTCPLGYGGNSCQDVEPEDELSQTAIIIIGVCISVAVILIIFAVIGVLRGMKRQTPQTSRHQRISTHGFQTPIHTFQRGTLYMTPSSRLSPSEYQGSVAQSSESGGSIADDVGYLSPAAVGAEGLSPDNVQYVNVGRQSESEASGIQSYQGFLPEHRQNVAEYQNMPNNEVLSADSMHELKTYNEQVDYPQDNQLSRSTLYMARARSSHTYYNM